jgi:recombination protein RecT
MKMTDQNAIVKVSKFMRSDATKANFAEIVGERNAGAYISSVLLAVAASDQLQKCSIDSIYISAMRAATLRLSVDPSTGQAYLVPFGDQATLIVGYKGLHDMAVRTGKYRYINTNPIYEGITVTPHPISGLITVESLGGAKKSDKIIGWLSAFEMNPERGQRTGYAHTLYMTCEECQAHGKKYSKSYGRKNSKGEYTSKWQTDPESMEKKTVLRLLLRRWGYLDPADIQTLENIEAEPEFSVSVDVDAAMEETAVEAKFDEQKALAELGYTEEKPKSKKAEQPELEPAG